MESVAPHVGAHQLSGFRFSSRWTHAANPTLSPILLLGGTLQRKDGWGRLEQVLLGRDGALGSSGSSADVIAVDLPGWADSDLLPDSYPMDTLAYAALTVLDDLDLDQVHLAGFSYGAVVAFRIAQLHPERLRRLVLVGATPTLPDEVVARSLDVVALGEAGHADSFADQLLDLFTSADAPVRGQPVIRRMLRPAFAGASRHDVAKFAAHARRAVAQRALHPVPAPSTPTLTVTGAHDAYTTPQMCREVAELCADSWFATIGEADHMVHLGRARELGDLMLRFLSDEPLHGLPYCETVERVRAGWPDPISPDVRTRAGAVPEPL